MVKAERNIGKETRRFGTFEHLRVPNLGIYSIGTEGIPIEAHGEELVLKDSAKKLFSEVGWKKVMVWNSVRERFIDSPISSMRFFIQGEDMENASWIYDLNGFDNEDLKYLYDRKMARMKLLQTSEDLRKLTGMDWMVEIGYGEESEEVIVKRIMLPENYDQEKSILKVGEVAWGESQEKMTETVLGLWKMLGVGRFDKDWNNRVIEQLGGNVRDINKQVEIRNIDGRDMISDWMGDGWIWTGLLVDKNGLEGVLSIEKKHAEMKVGDVIIEKFSHGSNGGAISAATKGEEIEIDDPMLGIVTIKGKDGQIISRAVEGGADEINELIEILVVDMGGHSPKSFSPGQVPLADISRRFGGIYPRTMLGFRYVFKMTREKTRNGSESVILTEHGEWRDLVKRKELREDAVLDLVFERKSLEMTREEEGYSDTRKVGVVFEADDITAKPDSSSSSSTNNFDDFSSDPDVLPEDSGGGFANSLDFSTLFEMTGGNFKEDPSPRSRGKGVILEGKLEMTGEEREDAMLDLVFGRKSLEMTEGKDKALREDASLDFSTSLEMTGERKKDEVYNSESIEIPEWEIEFEALNLEEIPKLDFAGFLVDEELNESLAIPLLKALEQSNNEDIFLVEIAILYLITGIFSKRFNINKNPRNVRIPIVNNINAFNANILEVKNI